MVDINVAMQEVNQAEGVSFRAVEPESPFIVMYSGEYHGHGTLKLGFEASFPYSLPSIFVSPVPTMRLHIDDKGKICLTDESSLLLDTKKPAQLITECLKLAERVLNLSPDDPQYQAELKREFMSYWGLQGNGSSIWSILSIADCQYYVEEKMAFLHSDRLDEPNFSLQSEHLLVSIATTYPIKEEDLSYIDPTNTMIRYNIQVDRMGYDFFNSNQKIRSYADRIIDDLRKLVRERGIETIHFAISSSVPFTFYLAQQMNTNQFSKIIVYHFERGKYTWGIDVTESDARKSIKWAGLTEEQMD